MDARHGWLPRPGDGLFLTDGGIETYLIHHEGLELPDFAAFVLLRTAYGRETLRRYYRRYLDIARAFRAGFIFETATWRASADWGARLGYDAARLAQANREAVRLAVELRADNADSGLPMLVSGCVGPRGDGYRADRGLTAAAAAVYHRPQIETFAGAGIDLVTAITMNGVPEAIGFVRAAGEAGLPAVVSFTVETDGRLPSGTPLAEAVVNVDEAAPVPPVYFMLNCAHPVHMAAGLGMDPATAMRIRGLRANASRASHAALDAATDLDEGDPEALAADCLALRARLPALQVLGGCCGTDHRHVARIGAAWRAIERNPPEPRRPAA